VLFAAGSLSAADAAFKFVDPKGQPVTEVVISLTRLDAPPAIVEPGPPAEIIQENKEFKPHVLAIGVGSSVAFSNRETKAVQHQCYSLSDAKRFEIPLHKPGNTSPILFDKPGVVVVGCNIHDWMNAYIVVLATPWFAQSADAGTATIAGAPAGRYRADVWHARQEKPESRELALPADGAVTFTLALKPERRVRRIQEAGGAGYK
jgi:hypothetical protein